MAASDARPVPRKNVAFRYYFAIRKNDGTLITTWAGQDSEVDKDGAGFVDCTNEAIEIGTTGIGYLDLTATEMNADAVNLKITVTNTSALALVVTFFPEEVGDYRANVEQFGGSNGTFAAGRPEVNTTHLAGTAYASADLSATMKASVNTEADTALTDYGALKPTTAGRTLDVSTDGDAEANVTKYGGTAGTFAGGRPETNVSHWKGTAAAAADTAGYPVVTIKDGTGQGELLTTLGKVDNVLLVDVATTLTNDPTGVTTLLSRISASRAGYLDNLNVGGAVASQADITALNQSASRRVILTTVGQYERPESGTVTYTVEARTYDGDGAAVNADSNPTLTATGIVSGDLSANLSAITNPATGVYRWTYTVATAAALEQVRFDVSATMTTAFTLSVYTQVTDLVGATFTTADRTKIEAVYNKLPSKSYLTGTANSDGDVQLDEATGALAKGTSITGFNDLDAGGVRTAVGLASANLDAQLTTIDDFLDTEVAAIKAKTDNLPASPAAVGSAMTLATDAVSAAALSAGAVTEIQAGLATQASVDIIDDFLDTEVAAIKAKTDNLPSDPADASDIAASFASLAATLATVATYVDTEVAAIKAKTDNLPSDPADQSAVEAALTAVQTALTTLINAVDDAVDTEVAAVKAVTDKLDTAMVLDGAVYKFTANALEEAPLASGGDATAANQTTIINHLTGIKGSGWEAGDNLKVIEDTVASLSAGTGIGAFEIDLTIRLANNTLVPECDVILTASNGSPNVDVVATDRSNPSAIATFYLDAGTYYIWCQKLGLDFHDVNPRTLTVNSDGSSTVT